MLEKLRAKPDHFKKAFSLALTILIFSGILFVWVTSWDARSNQDTTLEKTASPVASLSSMIDGLVLDFKDFMSSTPSFVKNGTTLATSTPSLEATSTDNFDMSGVVVIDPSASTTVNSSSSLLK